MASVGLAIAAIVFFATLAGFVYLGSDARRAFAVLETSTSDNLDWSVAQLEIDSLKLQRSIIGADPDNADDLRQVRLAYDIFYSRVDAINGRSLINTIPAKSRIDPLNRGVLEFRERLLPIIDGPDSQLAASLDWMASEIEAILPEIRSLTTLVVVASAETREDSRNRVRQAVNRLALLTLLLFLSLLAVAVASRVVAGVARTESARRADAVARLSTVIETSLDGVIVTDSSGTIIQMNGAAEATFGYTWQEALGQRIADLIIPEHLIEAHEAAMSRHLQTGETSVIGKGRVRLEGKRRDGTVFPVELSLSSARDGTDTLLIAYLRDITSEVETESGMIAARDRALQGERAKARLLAVMSHEIRTPLNGLLGALELLSETPLNETQSKYTRVMKSSGDILMRHVNDVLDISRLDADRYDIAEHPFELQAILDEVVENQSGAARAKGNRLSSRVLDPTPRFLIGDPVRIVQVLLNLVGNANKFTRDGVVLIECEYNFQDSAVEFRVSDSGIGIPQSEQQSIFEDFVTIDDSYGRRAEGTGLGLGIARRLVRAMGGDLTVESEPGSGSVFAFSIPAPQAQSLTAAPRPDVQSPYATQIPLEILLVEDNDLNRLVARDMLEHLGQHVTEAADGEAALDLAATRAFDVILIDISMPGLDGFETSHLLRTGGGLNSLTPIIALTANVMPGVEGRIQAAGMHSLLLKPITRAILRRELESLFGTRIMPVTAPARHPISKTAIEDLRQALGATELANRVRTFCDEVEKVLADMADADRVDPTVLAAAIHYNAGSAAILGLGELHAALASAETSLRGPSGTDSAALLAELRPVWDRAKDLLAEHTL